jgi:polyisoprenoid-binding protein YceI
MKTKSIKFFLLAVSVLAVFGFTGVQSPYSSKQSKMTVSGTSSLHEWESEVTKVEWKGALQLNGSELVEVKDVLVKIPVTGIKSSKGKIMDNKTYEAFNSDKNPVIQYKLITAKIKGSGPDYTIATTGNLTMAGATKPVDLMVKAKVLANGDVQLTASTKLNMKDFSMTPPTAMMGTIKVGEEVTVAFDITLTPTK